MNGFGVINSVYIAKSIPVGTTIICKKEAYEVFSSRNGAAIRKVSTVNGKQNPAIHNCPFPDLLDFMNSEVNIVTTVDFREAARLNRKMKPIVDKKTDFMNLKDALSYMSNVKDNTLLKTLLEDKVWAVG